MRLIRLSANTRSFKTIEFNTDKPLTLIVGKKENPHSKNLKDTYNGVGKSLSIQLVHFCLASNSIDEFEDKLPGWGFTLEFEVGDKVYSAYRNTQDQKYIYLNDKKMKLNEFRSHFERELFSIDNKVSNLTFRTLISRFIRPKKSSYMAYNVFGIKEEEYAQLLNNSYLLGLDIQRIVDKKNLKEELDKIKSLKENIEKDEVLKEYFTEKQDLEISIIDLEEKIQSLESKLKNFEVAENYHHIRKEADDISYEIKGLENKSTLLANAIKNIDKSLQIKPDISKEKIIHLYEEAQIKLPELVVKNVNEVADFHNNLIIDREKRLLKEKAKLKDQSESIKARRDELGHGLDKLLSFLDTHGALDELVALTNLLNEYKAKLSRLNDYKGIMEQYNNKISEIKIQFENENIETNSYLSEVKPVIERNRSLFRSVSKEFYSDKPGGITIVNNEGQNKLRFDINARIQDDASDGINEVKIFCFDFTLLRARHNHNIDFIIHDSRLFSNMDPRQRATLFKLAYQNSLETGLQYIATVNEDMLTPLKELYTDAEYKKIIEDNIVLTLTDRSDESKLLGIKVDMDYEK